MMRVLGLVLCYFAVAWLNNYANTMYPAAALVAKPVIPVTPVNSITFAVTVSVPPTSVVVSSTT